MSEDRRKDEETRKRIDELEKQLRAAIEEVDRGYRDRGARNAARIDRLNHLVSRLGTLIVVLVISLLGLGGLAISLEFRAGTQARQARALARRIQAERVDTLRRECENQNERHRATVRQLDAELSLLERHATPAGLAMLKANRAATVALIQTLSPLQDCAKVVRLGTTTPRHTRRTGQTGTTRR